MKILICEQSEEFVDHMVKTIRSYPCDEEIIIESYTDTVGIARRIEKENFDPVSYTHLDVYKRQILNHH